MTGDIPDVDEAIRIMVRAAKRDPVIARQAIEHAAFFETLSRADRDEIRLAAVAWER